MFAKKAIANFNRLPTIQKIVVLAVIGLVAYWLYKRYMAKREGMNGSAGSDAGNGEIVCTLYYTDWCPHCKTVKPEWAKLRDAMHGKPISGGRIVLIKMVNCEEDKAAAEAAGVQGFPTIKIVVNGTVRDYSGERTFSAFQQYISAL